MKLADIPRYDSVLLLQGPVGSFFKHFGRWLRGQGSEVYKVNLNVGDDFFYGDAPFRFRDTFSQFERYLRSVLEVTSAKAIFLFGEHRPHHEVAARVAAQLGIDVWAFEEGLIRPGYVTLECLGTRDRLHHEVKTSSDDPQQQPGERTFLAAQKMWVAAFVYFSLGWLSRWIYPDYEHHKPFAVAHAYNGLLSLFRKMIYRPVDAWRHLRIKRSWGGKYFLVPLQVFNDYSVLARSELGSVQNFIDLVMRSFAAHGAKDEALVFKHHPMDRGYTQYGQFIDRLAKRLGLVGRVFYVHDCHMPTLMRDSRGVVMINSTAGYQAMSYGVPVLAMGSALYCDTAKLDLEALAAFWSSPKAADFAQSRAFVRRVVNFLQLPGSFYDLSWLKRQIPGEVDDSEPSVGLRSYYRRSNEWIAGRDKSPLPPPRSPLSSCAPIRRGRRPFTGRYS